MSSASLYALLVTTIVTQAAIFEDPIPIKAGGERIQIESPGFASPCLVDLNGDGINELLVGQFNGGKIQVFSKDKNNDYQKGTWLKADGKIAEVPGVW